MKLSDYDIMMLAEWMGVAISIDKVRNYIITALVSDGMSFYNLEDLKHLVKRLEAEALRVVS